MPSSPGEWAALAVFALILAFGVWLSAAIDGDESLNAVHQRRRR